MANIHYESPAHAILHWSMGYSRGYIKILVPMVILWSIWENRNKAKFENAPFSSYAIISRVKNIVFMLNSGNILTQKSWKGYFDSASLFSCLVLQVPNTPMKITRWEIPPTGFYKLNCAGISKGTAQMSAAGAIIRDWFGNCCFAFGYSMAEASSKEAEIGIMLSTLEFCIDQNLVPIAIESASSSIVKAISTGKGEWRRAYTWDKLHSYLQLTSSTIRSISRKNNCSAIYLAKKAATLGTDFGMSDDFKDAQLQSLVILDLVCPQVEQD